jgi:3-hydroxyacyl-CoA dehydrogenase/3a,7a,12a-trihydroxy-5b-cholest-24-enoyl-CoA hydratase
LIKSKGGIAVANFDSVVEGDKIIKAALDNFGTVDILINNAGILKDVSFVKMSDEDFDLVVKCHLYGTFKTCRAAWNIMRDKSFGRIINTSSGSGLYGAFG